MRIPTINNKTEVIILQHKRERVHPFNTARIVNQSLSNCRLLVDHTPQLAQAFEEVQLSSNAGLLYPSDDSQSLEDLPVGHRLDQLVVLDGTWHHTKTLFRDIPSLQSLPKYRLTPSQPSQYIIRREPQVNYISTLEAIVAALKAIEPDTQGLDDLTQTFVEMIRDQLSLPQSEFGARRHHRLHATGIASAIYNIPIALRTSLENIVVVYGETAPGNSSSSCETQMSTVYWVAERLSTGECFAETIQPKTALSPTFLRHIALPEAAFKNALSVDQFRLQWNEFLCSKDIITYYFSNTPKLIDGLKGPVNPTCHLKSVKISADHKSRTLDELLSALEVQPTPPKCPGRAGQRLAWSVAFAKYLHESCNPIPSILSVAEECPNFSLANEHRQN